MELINQTWFQHYMLIKNGFFRIQPMVHLDVSCNLVKLSS